MSGGGSGASYYDTSGGAGFDCSTLVERTYLNSPVAAVVSSLMVGDVLDVQLQTGSPAPSLLAVHSSGATAGSLTPPRLPQIIDCIQQGFTYVAVVQQINGGQVTVEIRAK
jgi:hypothetical protein